MKTLLRVLLLSALSLPALAQLQTFKGDSAQANVATRINIGANSAGRVGSKGSTGNFQPFALLSEVLAAITSVNGKTGSSVTITTSDIAEGTNPYFTNARARSALSGTAPIGYNATTGGITFTGTKSDVGLGNVDNTSDANKPISTATQTALNAKEGTITAGTTGQYYRGDKTFVTLDKTAVGLSNVDNTSDVSKPVSTAQQTALILKADIATSIYRDDVASYAALGSYTVPSGKTYLIKVASDESQSAPYNTNQWYLKDSSGNTFKFALIKQ